MKVLRRVVVLCSLLLLCCPIVSAQSNDAHAVRKQVSTLLAKYGDEKGVLAMECDGGVKLQTVKMMLRKEFGSEFVDAVRAFAIMLYQDASSECKGRIVGDIGRITQSLQEIDVAARMKKGDEARGYVRVSESGKKITNLVIVVAAPKPKLIYIEGEFDADGTYAVK